MQMLTPPQSLHRDLRRPWMQMPTPPHSLHRDFFRPWMQFLLDEVLAPRLSRLLMQMHAPQQVLHRGLSVSCVQTDGLPCFPTFWRFDPLWQGSDVSGQIGAKLQLFVSKMLLP